MKGCHRKAPLQQEHRGKATNHQNKLRTLSHIHTNTHTLSSACQPPTFTLEEEGHSGPVEE